jgi:hypothetical protein
VSKIHFYLPKQIFLLQIDFSVIINCDTFSLALSMINDNKRHGSSIIKVELEIVENNGTARFKKYKQSFEYQHLLLLGDI